MRSRCWPAHRAPDAFRSLRLWELPARKLLLGVPLHEQRNEVTNRAPSNRCRDEPAFARTSSRDTCGELREQTTDHLAHLTVLFARYQRDTRLAALDIEAADAARDGALRTARAIHATSLELQRELDQLQSTEHRLIRRFYGASRN